MGVKVTLKQVAQVADVHYSTAASILNNAGGNSRFSQATLDRVKQVADELGYVANVDAQRLRTQRTMTIGFAAGDIRNPFFAELAIALENQLHAHGYELLLASHGQSQPTEDAPLVRKLVGRSVDAIIVWAEGQDTLTPQQVHKERGKVVWLGWCEDACYHVHVDVQAGLEKVSSYLATQGHRHVGFYGPQPIAPNISTRRQILFQDITRHHKIHLTSLPYDGASWDIHAASQSGRETWQQIMEQKLTAVVAYNDVSAVGLLLSRPSRARSVTVISFDGTALLRSWQPAVPYVHFSFTQMAAAATELALHAAQNKRPPRKQHLQHIEPTLICP